MLLFACTLLLSSLPSRLALPPSLLNDCQRIISHSCRFIEPEQDGRWRCHVLCFKDSTHREPCKHVYKIEVDNSFFSLLIALVSLLLVVILRICSIRSPLVIFAQRVLPPFDLNCLRFIFIERPFYWPVIFIKVHALKDFMSGTPRHIKQFGNTS